MDLLKEARDLHHVLMRNRVIRETQRLERQKYLGYAAGIRKYEQESFDISSSTPPEDLQAHLSDDILLEIIKTATETVEENVFGYPPKSWMVEVAGICRGEAGLQFVRNAFWWQTVLDQMVLRSARIILTRAKALPAVKTRRKELMMEPDFAQVPFERIAVSNCIPLVDEGSDLELDDLEDDDVDKATQIQRSHNRARKASVQYQRRTSSHVESTSPMARADDGQPPPSSSPTPILQTQTSSLPPVDTRARSGRSRGRARKRAVNSNGLREVVVKLSDAYSKMFIDIVSAAARLGSHTHTLQADETAIGTRGGRKLTNTHTATVMELTTKNSLRDRACSFMRAVMIESIATVFYRAYENSESLKVDMMLHHTSLRERVARTVDELMFGQFAPPGMLMWAPSTIGLASPPKLPTASTALNGIDYAQFLSSQTSLTAATVEHALTEGGSGSSSAQEPLESPTLNKIKWKKLKPLDTKWEEISAAGASSPTKSVGLKSVRPLPAASAQLHNDAHEWSTAIKEQLAIMLSSMDSRTRLNLLMPTLATGDAQQDGVLTQRSNAAPIPSSAHPHDARPSSNILPAWGNQGSAGNNKSRLVSAKCQPRKSSMTRKHFSPSSLFTPKPLNPAPYEAMKTPKAGAQDMMVRTVHLDPKRNKSIRKHDHGPSISIGDALADVDATEVSSIASSHSDHPTSLRDLRRSRSVPVLKRSISTSTMKRTSSKWHLGSPTAGTSASEVRARMRTEHQAESVPKFVNTDLSADLQRALVEHRRRMSWAPSDPLQIGAPQGAKRDGGQNAHGRRASISSVLNTLGPAGLDGSTLAAKAVNEAVAKHQHEKALRKADSAALAVNTAKKKKQEELKSLAEEFRLSALDDVPVASATFIYSPLIMSSIGAKAGALGLSKSGPQFVSGAFPRAVRHAINIKITDPPAAVGFMATDAAQAAEIAANSVKHSILQAGIAGNKARGIGGEDVPQGLEYPTLNLFLMAQLQQLHYDPKIHTVKSSLALLPRIQPSDELPRKDGSASSGSALHGGQRRGTSTSRPSSGWRLGRPSSPAHPKLDIPLDEDTTFLTSLALDADPPEKTIKQVPEMEIPPISLPIALLSNISIADLLDPRKTNKSVSDKSNLEIEYGMPVEAIKKSASVPGLVASGTRRTLSSISSVTAAGVYEDKLHEALVQFTEASLSREEELIRHFREREFQTRKSLQQLQSSTNLALSVLEDKKKQALNEIDAVQEIASRITSKRQTDFQHVQDELMPGMARKRRAQKEERTTSNAKQQYDAVEAAALGLTEEDINRIQADALKAIQLNKKGGKLGGSSSAPDLGLSSGDTLRRLKRETGAAIVGATKPGAAAKAKRASALIVMESLNEGDEDDDSYRWIEKYEGEGLRDARNEREFRERERIAREREAEAAARQSLGDGDLGGKGAMARLTASILEATEMEGTTKFAERREMLATQDRQLQMVLRRRRYELGSTFAAEKGGVPWHKQNASGADAAINLGRQLGVSPGELTIIKHSVDKRRLRDAILLQRKQQTDLFRAAVSAKPKDSLLGKSKLTSVSMEDLEARLGNLRRVSAMVQDSVPSNVTVYQLSEGSKLHDLATAAAHDSDLMKFDTAGMEALGSMTSQFVAEKAHAS